MSNWTGVESRRKQQKSSRSCPSVDVRRDEPKDAINPKLRDLAATQDSAFSALIPYLGNLKLEDAKKMTVRNLKDLYRSTNDILVPGKIRARLDRQLDEFVRRFLVRVVVRPEKCQADRHCDWWDPQDWNCPKCDHHYRFSDENTEVFDLEGKLFYQCGKWLCGNCYFEERCWRCAYKRTGGISNWHRPFRCSRCKETLCAHCYDVYQSPDEKHVCLYCLNEESNARWAKKYLSEKHPKLQTPTVNAWSAGSPFAQSKE